MGHAVGAQYRRRCGDDIPAELADPGIKCVENAKGYVMGHHALTKNQQLVLNCLKANECALTAYDILDVVREGGIRAPVQVYRALEFLVTTGVVHRIESMNAYVACAHEHGNEDTPHNNAVAFTICDDCGVVSEISVPAAERTIDELAEKSGFIPDRTVVELHGHCANCSGSMG